MRLALSLAIVGLSIVPCAAQVAASVHTPRALVNTQDTALLSRAADPGGSDPGGSTDGATPVPEPSALLLVGTGLVGVALTAVRRRRRRKQ